MLQTKTSALKHIVHAEALLDNPYAPSNPTLAAAPRSWVAPATTSSKCRGDTEGDDEKCTAKRTRSIVPAVAAVDGMDVEPITIGGGTLPPTSSHSSTFTLPNSQGIGKDSQYRSWGDTAPNPQAALGALYGYEDSESCLEQDDSGSDLSGDGLTDIAENEDEGHVQPQSKLPSDPLGLKNFLERESNDRIAETISESALPAMHHALR
ncbi:hypothetical protein GY45DRAFT_1375571 [Cubamyces sp. BRFM 1775]|nr:hypothetical protein GY45DRAFT_1375571 [Cubamyces sp. BRFM 1775]